MSRRELSALTLVFLLLPLCALAADIDVPQFRGYINDFAGIIPQSDEQAIAAYIDSLEKATTAEIAVVTVQTVKPYTIAQYGIALGDQWAVGKADKDNGAIIIVAVDDREMRIEVGYGLEHLIPDAEAVTITDKIMRPAFRQDNYAFGISQAVMHIGNIIAADQGVTVQRPAGTVMPARRRQNPVAVCGGVPCFFILLVLMLLLRLRLWPFLLLGGLSRGRHWSAGGFSSGGGGFGGGFGGFGGGGFGGGGASGSW